MNRKDNSSQGNRPIQVQNGDWPNRLRRRLKATWLDFSEVSQTEVVMMVMLFIYVVFHAYMSLTTPGIGTGLNAFGGIDTTWP